MDLQHSLQEGQCERLRNREGLSAPLHGEFEGTTVGPREVFEAWLYGLVFHQDPEQTKVAEELAKYQGGFAFPFAVNAVALQLAGVILDLDDVIARFLGEAPMPRISGESQSDAEPSTPDASELRADAF